MTVELLRHLNYNKTNLEGIEIKVEHFIELLQFIKKGKITELQAKQILNKFYPKSFSLSEEGVEKKIDSENELEKVCKEIIKENKDAVEKYKLGDKKVLNFLIGEVMKKTNKRADFRIVREIMERLLEDQQ